jgi:hypothetical protein
MSQTTYLHILEIRDRMARITSTGSEVIVKWYCEPASAAPIVIAQMLGGISGMPSSTSATRVVPAYDYAFPYCYCVSAQEVPLDSRSITSSPPATAIVDPDITNTTNSIGQALQSPAIFDGPLSCNLSTNEKYQQPDTQGGTVGCYIEATYRPLYSAYAYNFPGSSKDPTAPASIDRQVSFDYIDPQFHPGSKTFDVSTSLNPLLYAFKTQQLQQGGLLTETWHEFTIRRVLCPSVPFYTIQLLANRINGTNAWAPTHMKLPRLPVANLSYQYNPANPYLSSSNIYPVPPPYAPTGSSQTPCFPVGTLRFDYADVIPRTMPNWNLLTGTQAYANYGNPVAIPVTSPIQWYDIIYHFTWRSMTGYWTDFQGFNSNFSMIPWYCEWWQVNGAVPEIDSVPVANSTRYPGWYEVAYPSQIITGSKSDFTALGSPYNHKYRHAEAGDVSAFLNPTFYGVSHQFDILFLQDAP